MLPGQLTRAGEQKLFLDGGRHYFLIFDVLNVFLQLFPKEDHRSLMTYSCNLFLFLFEFSLGFEF